MKIETSGIIVTGGASGLGLATAKALREAGARVGVIDLQGPGGWDGAFAAADVTDEVAVAAALDTLEAKTGPLRGMLNAAGGGGGTGLSSGEHASLTRDRKSVGSGERVYVRVDLGGSRTIKKKKK